MYTEALAVLACPDCKQPLAPTLHEVDAEDEIITATLRCPTCQRAYPVRGGIADFLGKPQPQTPAQVVNEWSLTAWAYERVWRPFALSLLSQSAFPYRRELPLIVEMVELKHGGFFLDIACSNGLYARAITRASGGMCHAIGVDHAMPMLHEARQRAKKAQLRVSYVRAEAQSLPICPSTIHAAGIGGSLNEIGDVEGCLMAAQQALTDDGHLVTMTLATACTPLGRAVQQLLRPGGIQFWTSEALAMLLKRCGLPVTKIEAHGIVLFTASKNAEPNW